MRGPQTEEPPPEPTEEEKIGQLKLSLHTHRLAQSKANYTF